MLEPCKEDDHALVTLEVVFFTYDQMVKSVVKALCNRTDCVSNKLVRSVALVADLSKVD